METERYMKRCYELAIEAGKKGYDTFGVVLVHNGKIIEEEENTAGYPRGIFGHAELYKILDKIGKTWYYGEKIQEDL